MRTSFILFGVIIAVLIIAFLFTSLLQVSHKCDTKIPAIGKYYSYAIPLFFIEGNIISTHHVKLNNNL